MAGSDRAMRDVFLSAVLKHMGMDPKVVLLSADFGSPVMDSIRKEFPARFFNVGIAEANLINISAGLALEGFKVIAYAIAPFITMRCYEQIRVNLGILGQVRKMNVTLAGVGAGCSYAVSGPTHQCFEDLSIMRVLPNVSFFSPSDPATAGSLVPHFLDRNDIRYIRMDAKVLPDIGVSCEALGDGCRIVNHGKGNCILATGYMVHVALEACRKLKESGAETPVVVDVFRIKPVPEAAVIRRAVAGCRKIITLEEGFVNAGGLDAMVLQLLNGTDLQGARIVSMGVRSEYCFDPGKREVLMQKHGIDPDSVINALKGTT